MSFADDFDRILSETGEQITLVRVQKSTIDGYVETTETQENILAVVQPLSSEELAVLANTGITTEALKAYISTTAAAETGDKVLYNGSSYKVHNIEETKAYKKLILRREL